MGSDRNKGLEVGESSGFGDYLKTKLKPANNKNIKNAKDINDFITKNSISQWAQKDEN